MTTPTPEQIHRALLNYYRPLRTNGSKVKAAIDHAKNSQLKKPGAATNSDRAKGNMSNALDENKYTPPAG